MDAAPRTANRLVEIASQYWLDGNVSAFRLALEGHWPMARLLELLHSPRRDVARGAASALGLMGGMPHSESLAAALHYPDAAVADEAETSLWSIWFRAGGSSAQARLQEQVRHTGAGNVRAAINGLTDLIRCYPIFAEAYHQRATAHLLAGNPLFARHDYVRAIKCNPHHFGACAGLGHCLAQLGFHADALCAYLRARHIHPRLEGVRQSIRRIREMLSPAKTGGMPVHTEAPERRQPQLRLAAFDSAGSMARK